MALHASGSSVAHLAPHHRRHVPPLYTPLGLVQYEGGAQLMVNGAEKPSGAPTVDFPTFTELMVLWCKLFLTAFLHRLKAAAPAHPVSGTLEPFVKILIEPTK